MLRFYLDEDSMFRALIRALRDRGFDVVSTAEAGRLGRPDADQLAFAAGEGRVLVTRNIADFSVLHQQYVIDGRQHAGIMLLPEHRFAAGQYVRAFARLDETPDQESLINRLVFLSNWF